MAARGRAIAENNVIKVISEDRRRLSPAWSWAPRRPLAVGGPPPGAARGALVARAAGDRACGPPFGRPGAREAGAGRGRAAGGRARPDRS